MCTYFWFTWRYLPNIFTNPAGVFIIFYFVVNAGATHKTLSFDSGSIWSQIPSDYLWNPVLKYGATTKLTCGTLQLERGHVRIEHPMIDLCEECRCIRATRKCLHNKFRFFNQYEVYSKTSDPFLNKEIPAL